METNEVTGKMNARTYLFGLLLLHLKFKGIPSYVNYCSETHKPVVNICQTKTVIGTKTVYVNSGGAPILQRVTGCRCLVYSGNSSSTFFVNILNTSHLSDDLIFTANDIPLVSGSNIYAEGIDLVFSKTSEESQSGVCINITSDGAIVNVNCTASNFAATSAGTETSDSRQTTFIATGASVGSIVIIAVVVTTIVIMRRKRKKANNKADDTKATGGYVSDRAEQDEKADSYYGMQLNPAYEHFDGDSEINAVRMQYEEIDDHGSGNKNNPNKPSEYEYVTCKHSSGKDGRVFKSVKDGHMRNVYDHTTASQKERHNDRTKSADVDSTYDSTTSNGRKASGQAGRDYDHLA